MTATIKRVDDSYIVRFPASVFDNANIKESEVMQVFEECGRIVIQKSDVPTIANDASRTTISELFEGYEDEYETVQIDWGAPVGKEILFAQ
jgi:antitoxin MazE